MIEPPPRARGSNTLAKIFVALVFPLFLCGGLISGYIFYDTVRVAIAGYGVPALGGFVRQGPDASAPAPPRQVPNIAAGERVNVLLLGIDKREGEHGPWRTDTMIIATMDPKTQSAGMLSIARDLYVPIPMSAQQPYPQNRINTANFYGDLNKYPGGGPALAKKTVELNFGVPIHYYVLVDFNGFRQIVNALGGIDVDVPYAIDDNQYPDENYGYKTIHIPAGRIHMDGEMALEYARSRHTTNDFERSKRQMQILLAIRERALRLDILPKLPTLINQLKDAVQTDLTPSEALALAPAALQIKPEKIRVRAVDQTMTVQIKTDTGADVLWLERERIARAIEELFPKEAPSASLSTILAQEAAQIVVLNGTDKPGIAEQTFKYLQSQGYNVVQFGNADRNDYPSTVIIDYSRKSETVQALAQLFNVSPENLRENPNANSDADIRVILGADWQVPEGAGNR
jgi:LCP family protein required for cell wall assembly